MQDSVPGVSDVECQVMRPVIREAGPVDRKFPSLGPHLSCIVAVEGRTEVKRGLRCDKDVGSVLVEVVEPYCQAVLEKSCIESDIQRL